MKSSKQRYIDQIRTNTAYPTYRTFIGILTILGYVFAGLIVLAGLGVVVSPFGITYWAPSGGASYFVPVASVIVAAIIVFASRLWKEASLLLADIADSITDANSKTSSGQEKRVE